MISVLITGSKGFIGTHFIHECKKHNIRCFEIDRDFNDPLLRDYCLECDYVLHLAGVMRPTNRDEFYEVGNDLTTKMLSFLSKNPKKPTIIFASSTQATMDNDYGKSKTEIENTLYSFGKKTKSKIIVFRLSNVFGKWGRPNYNSVAATFCHNISNDFPIVINDPNTVVNFIYIDDVVSSFLKVVEDKESFSSNSFNTVRPIYPTKLKTLADTLYCFKDSVKHHNLPIINNDFELKLFLMFSSYLNWEDLHFETIDEQKAFNKQYFSIFNEEIFGDKGEYYFLKSCVLQVSVNDGFVFVYLKNARTNDEQTFSLSNKQTLIAPSGYYVKITSQKNKEASCVFVFVNKNGAENV